MIALDPLKNSGNTPIPDESRMEQLPVNGNEVSKPTLKEINQRFDSKIGEYAESCSRPRFEEWVQAPIYALGENCDGRCEHRAKDLVSRVCQEGKPKFDAGLTLIKKQPMIASYEAAWKSIETKLEDGRAVIFKGAATQVGGVESVFKGAYHVVLLVGTGIEGEGDKKRRFYIAFDPDLTATTNTRKLWAEQLAQNNLKKESDFNFVEPDVLYKMLKPMVLGENKNGLGPTFRKYYYPDTSRPMKNYMVNPNSG